MAKQYVRKKPDGTWEYSYEKPTDPNEPVITKEQVKARMGVGTFTEGTYPFGESYAMRELGEEALREAEPGPEERYGAPKRLASGLLEYTDPEGVTQTYNAQGRLISTGSPQHYANQYSPRDQRRVEKLYEQRSQIATDPELTEDERQSFLDDVDQQMSQIPPLSPEMKEPTAQERFDASLIKTPDGQVGTVNKSGEFKPITPSDTDAEQQKQILDMTSKIFMAQDDAAKNIGKAEVQARRIIVGREVREIPQVFDVVWDDMLSKLEDAVAGRATKKQMDEKMVEYRDMAMGAGIPREVAEQDFLKRWKEVADKASFWRDDIVPPFPKEYEKQLTKSAAVPVGAPAAAAGAEPFAAVGGVEVPVGGPPSAAMGVGGAPPTEIALPKTKADYDALPAGTKYLHPVTKKVQIKG